MRAVWSYTITADKQIHVVAVPAGSRLKHVDAYGEDSVALFMEAEPGADKVTRRFEVFRTNDPIPDLGPDDLTYVGTGIPGHGRYALHVYEHLPRKEVDLPLKPVREMVTKEPTLNEKIMGLLIDGHTAEEIAAAVVNVIANLRIDP